MKGHSACCTFVDKQLICLCGNRSGLYLKGNHLIFKLHLNYTCLQTHSLCFQYMQHFMRTNGSTKLAR